MFYPVMNVTPCEGQLSTYHLNGGSMTTPQSEEKKKKKKKKNYSFAFRYHLRFYTRYYIVVRALPVAE